MARFPSFGHLWPRAPPDNRLSRQEADDYLRQVFAAIFLQKVPRAADRRVGLALRAGHGILEVARSTTGDGVAVAKCAEERLLPAPQDLPRRAIGRGGGIIRRDGHDHRELARAR